MKKFKKIIISILVFCFVAANAVNAPYYSNVSLENTKCFSYRRDTRQTSNYTFKGLWSPDMYQ